jgi:hypothetical protein
MQLKTIRILLAIAQLITLLWLIYVAMEFFPSQDYSLFITLCFVFIFNGLVIILFKRIKKIFILIYLSVSMGLFGIVAIALIFQLLPISDFPRFNELLLVQKVCYYFGTSLFILFGIMTYQYTFMYNKTTLKLNENKQ